MNNNMIAELTTKLKTNISRCIAATLSILIVGLSIFLIPVRTNAETTTKNYPLLMETNDDGKPTGTNWKYYVKNFTGKSVFDASDDNFKAPVTETIHETGLRITWKSVSNADKYKVNVFNTQNENVFSTETENLFCLISTGTLSPSEYKVQIIAYKQGKKISASSVRPFYYSDTNVDNNIIQLNGKVSTKDRPYTDYLNAPTGKAYKCELNKNNTTATRCYEFSNLNKISSDTQAIAFWFGQELNTKNEWVALNFDFHFSSATENDFEINVDSSKKYFFIPTNPINGKMNVSISQTSLTQFDDDGVHGDFIEGYVIIPLNNFNQNTITKLKSSDNWKLGVFWDQKKSYVNTTTKVIRKNVTAADKMNIYMSDVQSIKDINGYLADKFNSTDSSFAVTDKAQFECNKYDSSSRQYYCSSYSDNRYTIVNQQYETFNMTDVNSSDKGMQLEFTAPENGWYDLAHKLEVVSNSKSKGSLYYKIEKEDNQSKTPVFPENDEFYEMDVNSNNPKADIPPVQCYLNKGDKVCLEAYAKLSAGDSLTVNIGNPTATFIKTEKCSEGDGKVYSAFDYFISNRLVTPTSNYYMSDRWDFKALKYLGNSASPQVTDLTKYSKSWSNALYYSADSNILGFWGMPNNNSRENIKLKLFNNNGVQMTYHVGESGVLSISLPLRFEGGKTAQLRILQNGNQVWPQSGFATVSGKVNTDAKVNYGDVIDIQIYSTGTSVVSGYTNPMATVYKDKIANLSYDTAYSPVWEYPYKNIQKYNGEYTPRNGALFDYGIIKGSKVNSADSFDSENNNLLYNEACGKTGYNFDNNNLCFSFEDSGFGMSLGFIPPSDGKYDISTALNVVNGKGKISVKLIQSDKTIWPENGNPYEVNASAGEQLSIPAIQVDCINGECISLVVTCEKSSSEPVKINLGTPIIYRFTNSVLIGSETTDIYTPRFFTVFDDVGNIPRTYAKGRFEYLISKKSTEIYADSYDKTQGKINITSQNTGFSLSDDGGATINIRNTDYTHIIRFVAPKDITGKIQFAASSANSGARLRLTKNGTQIWPSDNWQNLSTTEQPISVDCSLKKGDIIEWQAEAESDANISLNAINIIDIYHITNYNENSENYIAEDSNPFENHEYTGKYKRYNNEYWLFDIAKINNLKVEDLIVPDSYDSSKNNFLYSSATNSGYHFNNLLDATIKENYGVSLGFVAPRNDKFVLRSGLRIITENAVGDVYVRITNNNKTVWSGGSGNDWQIQSVASGEDIKIPLTQIELNKGDIVRIEIFAKNIKVNDKTTDTIDVSLASPQIFSESAKKSSNVNISANIYYSKNEFPYFNKVYTGKYIPIENRWNYELKSFENDNETTYNPDYYNGNAQTLGIMNSTQDAQYDFKNNQIILVSSASQKKGISLRYSCVTDAETIFSAVPSINSGSENANVKFRILNNNAQIWPQISENKNTTEWETLTSEKKKSAIKDLLSLNLILGDNVEIQLYAEPTGNKDTTVKVSLNASASEVESKITTKAIYNFKGEDIHPMQIDPFWSYEYSLDPNNVSWNRLSQFNSNSNYYVIPGIDYCGINGSEALIGLTTGSAYKKLGSNPVIAATFLAKNEGYYTLAKGCKASHYTGDLHEKIRITVNNKKVWPTNEDWCEIKSSAITQFTSEALYCNAGDIIRFETTAVEDYEQVIEPSTARFRLRWLVTINYSQYPDIYTSESDIFDMLTPEMYAYFKKLAEKSATQFDIDYAKHLAISLTQEDESDSNSDDDSLIDQPDYNYDDMDDEYFDDTELTVDTPGTDDIVELTPGKRLKTVKRYMKYYYPVLQIVLICIGALLIVGVVLIIILHKKGKINWFKSSRIKIKH